MPKKQTVARRVPVSKAALLARINRCLAKDDEALKAARGRRAYQDLGDFYILDYNRNAIIDKGVFPPDLGRKLGVLREWEQAEGFEE